MAWRFAGADGFSMPRRLLHERHGLFFAANSNADASTRFVRGFHQRRYPPPPATSPPMNAEIVKQLIQKGFPDAQVDVHGPDGVHFEARIVSAAFAGKAPLARHRMVYAALGELMGGEIHALSMKTYTPDELARAGG
jgi:acid stress-induced BolA-like protein IbaG/YrbA